MASQKMQVHQRLISIHPQLMAASGSGQDLMQTPTVLYISPTPASLVHRSASIQHPVVLGDFGSSHAYHASEYLESDNPGTVLASLHIDMAQSCATSGRNVLPAV